METASINLAMNKLDCVALEVVLQVSRPSISIYVTPSLRLERRQLYWAHLQTKALRTPRLLCCSKRMRLSWSSSKGICCKPFYKDQRISSTRTKTEISDATLFARTESKAPSFQWRSWSLRSPFAGQSERTRSRRARRETTVTSEAHEQIACTNSRYY